MMAIAAGYITFAKAPDGQLQGMETTDGRGWRGMAT